MEIQNILEMRNISKAFSGVPALKKVSFSVRKATVHALMGENGSGKSTLMKILVGLYLRDEGSIVFEGKDVTIHKVSQAAALGISMIFQELNPVPFMTVADNIFIGKEIGKFGFVDQKTMNGSAQEMLDLLEIKNIKPTDLMSDLSVAQLQMVEICKAFSNNSKFVIMDEPTSAITQEECDHLFKVVKKMKANGITFVFISHRLDEIFEIADDITVLRDGNFIAAKPISEVSKDSLIEMMVARSIKQLFPKDVTEPGNVKLSVRGISSKGAFDDVTFDVHEGEILGLAGLMGAGRTEVVEALFGVRKLSAGEICINGKKVSINSPKSAIKRGIALLTEDRKNTGIFPNLNLVDNMLMPGLSTYAPGLMVSERRLKQISDEQMHQFNVKAASVRQLITSLSGGNQQKILVARWLMMEPEIIIFDEPTRGIDVGAKSEIHAFLNALVKMKKSVIMISSELPEILGMSDRIVVMYEGRVSGVINREDATQINVMQLAVGHTI